MVSFNTLLIVLSGALLAQANPAAKRPTCCAADRCFAAASLPATLTPGISSFCQKYITKTRGTVTRTATTTRTVTTTTTSSRAAPPPFIFTTAVTVTATSSPATPSTTTVTATSSPVTPGAITVTATSSPVTPSAVTVTATATATETSATSCVVTSTTTFGTQVNYATRGANIDKRAVALSIPSVLTAGCSTGSVPQKVSSACSCFLTSKTTTVTRTSTRTVTATATGPVVDPSLTTTIRTVTATATLSTPAVPTVTATVTLSTPVVPTVTVTETLATPAVPTTTVTATGTETVESCTSTSTSFSYTGVFSCGIASPTAVASGTVTCDNVAPPGQTNARFRIEGGSEGTIFEDCIISGPRNITTPSGGTHLCDGTNNNANPAPGATLTTDISDAGMQEGFTFDGSYSNQFQDFFITSISNTRQTGNQFWGVARNLVYTQRGGCQEPALNGDEGLWAFDAFNTDAFLRIDPGYAVVRAGTGSISITVTAVNPNNGNPSPARGAVVNGQTSDANGNIQLVVPSTPGCYQYKAERSAAIRSNAFYLSVLPADGE